LQNVLAAYLVCQLKELFGVRVKNDLHNPFAIAQVDEYHTAVVASAISPATQGHFLIDLSGVENTTIMAAHVGNL
jgi:hypothetical protein